jgi:membrane-bound lytic murein transglycosylase D
MVKQLLATVISIFFISFVYAGEGKDNGYKITAAFSDTAGKKDDSLKQVVNPIVNDPKQEFKDLFTAGQSSNSINFQQLNPQAISFVEDYIEKFGESMEDIKDRGRPYLDMMGDILVQHGLPKELKYLAVIESNLQCNARSFAGAVGPWQFMPVTARNMGLRIGKKYDERRDFAKSTHAASKYLTSLYAIYGDWLLVIAAYNGGPGKVNAAIKKSGSRDFWTLQKFLPAESKNHVKKFIATHYIMEGGHGGITTATKDEAKNISSAAALTPEETANSKTQSISGRYNSKVIMKHITMDVAAFNKLNPDFDKLIASGSNYELRLPNDKMEIFLSKKPEILNESIQLLLNPVGHSTETSRL